MSMAFVTAPAAERTLTVGDYLLGAVELSLAAGALAFGAYRLRALLLGGWSGAPARLAELVLGVTGLILISEALGTFGGFGEGAMLAALVSVGIAAGLLAGETAAGRRRAAIAPPAPPSWGPARVVAVFACAALAAGWMVPTLGALAAGMDRADSLWYHMPLAARFVQTGFLGHIYFFDPVFLASFYPANSEVVHAVPILFFGRDIVSPLVNLGWLSVALLAAWCVGRPYGLGPQALIGASIALGSQSLVEFQAGEALNDITGVAFVLCAVAILVNGYAAGPDPGPATGAVAPKRTQAPLGTGRAPRGTASVSSDTEPVPTEPVPGGTEPVPRGTEPVPRGAEPVPTEPVPRGSEPVPSDTEALPSGTEALPSGTRAGTHWVSGSASGTGAPAALASGRAIAPPALSIAGLAAGLAAGVKLSFLAPVAALTVAVVVIAPRAARLRSAALWGLPMLAAGGYWYARNLIAVGNPIPYIASVGPISLPAPARDFQLRPDFAVVHYWNDTGVWRHWFAPGLDESFGTLWPLTVAGMIAVAVFALWRGRDPILRALGAFVIVTAIAYVFTPLTAAGEEGEPISFVWNVRYLAPAVAVGFAILPCLPAFRATPGRRTATLVSLAVLLAFTVGSLVQWKQGHTKGAVAAAVLVVAATATLVLLRSRGVLGPAARPRIRVALAVGALGIAVAAGYAEQDHYLTHRYEDTGRVQDLAGAVRWSRDVRDARIALGGIRGVFTQYPFYGTDLSNRVQWLGERGPHDDYLRIPNCRQWRRAIDAGRYTHVVTTFDPYLPGNLRNSPEGRWTQSDPNTRVILRDGPVRVFDVSGPLDPAGCKGQRPLTQAQLHSVPNLAGTRG